MPKKNVEPCVYFIHAYVHVRVHVYAPRGCARVRATETERVKVAESAGQHESTGNVSRELGRGCNRRERACMAAGGRGCRNGGEGDARARHVHTCVLVLLIILHTARASRPPPSCSFESAREER